jgi:glyoxylase-like metal-dependent hydrolase (beta-lactamase superfamily II)
MSVLSLVGKPFVKKKTHEEVAAYEFAFRLIGRTFLTVHLFYVDGVLIDTAQRNAESLVLRTLRPYDIEKVLLTHWHEDHSGNLVAIYKQHRPQAVYAHPLTARIVRRGFSILPYEYLMLGNTTPFKKEILPLPDKIPSHRLTFLPMHTPGHSEDHTAYYVPERGWLFSGDLFVAEKIKFFRHSEDIAQQIDSLRKVATLDFDTLFCAHNPQFTNGKQAILRKLQYLEDFYGKVAAWYHKGLDEKEIMRRLPLEESAFIRLVTFGDVGLVYMVRSVIRNERKKKLSESITA